MTAEYRLRLAGSGGQGIVLAGLILAEAAVAAGKNATHAQAYGPESRGGATRSDVIVADGEIDYPYATRLDGLLALTQQAADQYAALVEPGGLLLADQDKVDLRPAAELDWQPLPIFATAQARLGTLLGANLVALGALVGLTDLLPPAAVEQVIARRKPGGSAEPGLRAFHAGLELAASRQPAVGLAGRSARRAIISEREVL